MTTIDCDQFHDVAPDLALGLLAGDDRGAALNHLVACSRCRRQLEGLVQVADGLLLLSPAVEPEIGFESRVMARLAADGAFSSPATLPPTEAAPAVGPGPLTVVPPESQAGRGVADPLRRLSVARRRWSRPILVGVSAALIVVAGLSGLVAGVTRGRSSAVGQQAQAANQLAARTVVIRADAGRSTCQLVAFPAQDSQPARLVVNLDEPGDTPSSYQVLAEPTDGGPAVVVGTIAMVNGHGMLAVSIPAATGPVDAVRIIEGAHTVRYRATFESV